MSIGWHQLPGPAAFLDRLAEGLRVGKSAIILTTDTTPGGVVRALKDLMAQDSFRWHSLQAGGESALMTLGRHFLDGDFPGRVLTLDALLTLPNFRSGIVQVEFQSREAWSSWVSFLEDYAYLARSMDPLGRTSFLAMVPYQLSTPAPKTDLLLDIYDLSESMGPVDIQVYALCLSEYTNRSPLRRRLAAAICAELAVWDRLLCETLCRASLRDLLSPERILLEYAETLGWERIPVEDRPSLAGKIGLEREIDDVVVVHSSWLACRGDREVLMNRVWKGQSGVLFPLIEVKRQDLLREYRYLFDVPHVSPDGKMILDVKDLDWGNICYQFFNNRTAVSRDLRLSAEALRDARNAIAHGEIIPLETIESGIFEKSLQNT